MSRRLNVPIFSSIVFILAVILYRTEETLGSVSEKLSKSTKDSEVYGDHAVTPVLDSSSVEADIETTTDLTTAFATTTATWIDSGNRHSEEPKLPVDLLSEDILLDPNVVLARVARNLDTLGSSSEYRYRRPQRRSGQTSNYNEPRNNRNYDSYKLPIYPVFPGKK